MIESDKEKLKFFYDLWTIKEAVIKAIGQGLSYPINTIEAIKLLIDKTILIDDKGFKHLWYYFPLEIIREYSGALAVERKVEKIAYIEMSQYQSIFDKIRFLDLSTAYLSNYLA